MKNLKLKDNGQRNNIRKKTKMYKIRYSNDLKIKQLTYITYVKILFLILALLFLLPGHNSITS